MAFSRVSFICKSPTRVTVSPASGSPEARDLVVYRGHAEDLERLPAETHPPDLVDRLRERLRTGETFVVGALNGRVVSYTWLRVGGRFDLHHLPGRFFDLAPGVGYGYDAWTDPAMRQLGIRRRVFAEELRMLKGTGVAWEVSYYVSHQLDGGRRNLAQLGVPIVELWRVAALRDGRVALRDLAGDPAVTPRFEYAPEERF